MSIAEILRILLITVSLALAVLALVYLGRRRLEWKLLPAWVLLAICLPVMGPILVIALQPGEPRV